MINDANEYDKAREELKYLEDWLSQLQQENPGPDKGLTKAGPRTMIARWHGELASYEGALEMEREHTIAGLVEKFRFVVPPGGGFGRETASRRNYEPVQLDQLRYT